MFQIVITLLIYMLIVIPIGIYLYRIAANKHTFADPVFDRVDNAIYRVSGINPEKGMNWKTYVLALVLTNAVMVFIGYMILRIQALPLFNPNRIEGIDRKSVV